MRHATLSAKGVELAFFPATHARAFNESLRVINAGVDHLTVSRARFRPDEVGPLEDQQLAPFKSQGARNSQSDDARARDDAIHLFGHNPTLH